ncbi:MAG: sigma-70 family RNA polymerase sigma factor [Vulcanimicrobiaceae bacterium]
MADAGERAAQIRRLLPLVRAIARRVQRLVPSMDLDDLIGDGSIGLIRAVDAFDPHRGPSLEHYAKHLIAGTMLNGIRRMDPVPERVRRTVRDGENARYRLAVDTGTMPSSERFEGSRPGLLRAMIVAHRAQPLSLDAPLPERESLPCEWDDDPAAIVAERAAARELRAHIHGLPPRHQALLALHYFAEQPLSRIGAYMGISPQRASQLHVAAITRLRKRYHAAPR